MKRFKNFLVKLFTKDIGIKILAIAMAVITVALINL